MNREKINPINWDSKLIVKTNMTVVYDNGIYLNISGKNSEPSDQSTDWIYLGEKQRFLKFAKVDASNITTDNANQWKLALGINFDDLDFLPLSGTEIDKPITGDIKLNESVKLINYESEVYNSSFSLEDGGFGFVCNGPNGTLSMSCSQGTQLTISTNDPNSKGITSSVYYGGNYDDNSWVQKKYVDDKLVLKADLTNGKVPASQLPITTNGSQDQISFFSTSSNISSDPNLIWDKTNKRLAIGVTSPTTSIDTNTLRLRSLPDGNSDITFTRSLIIKNDGTVGYETRSSPSYYPKVTINSYSQDATNYILKVTVSNMPNTGTSSTGGLFAISCIGSNPVDAIGITVTNDSNLAFVENIISTSPPNSLWSLDYTITFPKSSNTSPVWNNPNVLIGVLWKGTDNADGGSSSPYKPRRLSSDAKLIKEASLKQDALVSGSNIKTINGVSVLGSGNVLINAAGTEIKEFFDAFTGTTITLTNQPKSNTILTVIDKGVVLREGASRDYTVSNKIITFNTSKTSSDIEINYTY